MNRLLSISIWAEENRVELNGMTAIKMLSQCRMAVNFRIQKELSVFHKLLREEEQMKSVRNFFLKFRKNI